MKRRTLTAWPQKGKQWIVCEEPIITADYYPTILEMVGLSLQPEQHADGKSFATALKGETFERGALYWHFPHYSNHGMQSPCGAMRQGDYKLIEYYENETVQLFNLKSDPGEHNDLAASQPDTADMLHQELRSWRRALNAQIPAKKE